VAYRLKALPLHTIISNNTFKVTICDLKNKDRNMADITEKTENGELVTNRDQLVVMDNIESLIKVIRGQQRYKREYSNIVEKPNTLYHPQ
jgi:hypothetical protein